MSLNKDLEDRIKKESKILTRVNKKLESRLSIYKGSKDELKLYIDYVKFFSTWRGCWFRSATAAWLGLLGPARC